MSLKDELELNQQEQVEEMDANSDVDEVEKDLSGDENPGNDSKISKRKATTTTNDNSNAFVIPPITKGTFVKFDPSKQEFLTPGKLPLARVKRILKEDRGFLGASGDAYNILAKAAEMFIRSYAVDSYNSAAQDKRLTIAYKDCAFTVSSNERYEFLSEVVPSTMSFSKALLAQKQELPKKSSLANETPIPEIMQ